MNNAVRQEYQNYVKAEATIISNEHIVLEEALGLSGYYNSKIVN